MKLKLFTFTLLLTAGTFFTPKTYSQTPTPSTCPALYNGGIVCQEARDFSVDKKVQTPKDGSYVDRIAQGEAKIEAGRTMIFRIEITNKTTRTLRNIAVTDTLPGFVQYVRSDASVKQNGDKITYTVDTLESKKATKVNIETKIQPGDKLPKTPTPLCVANQVEARSGVNNLGRDFVTFCIDNTGSTQATGATKPTGTSFPDRTKGGQGVTSPAPTQANVTKGGQIVHPAPSTSSNPNTGPEMFALIGLLPAAAAGFWIRRKTRA